MAKGAPSPQPGAAPSKSSPALTPAPAKPTKRRSRSSSKPPITILSADAANFRSMVHKLTGFPSPSAAAAAAATTATAPALSGYPHPQNHPPPPHSSLHLWYSDGQQQQQQQQQQLSGYSHLSTLDSPAILYPGQTPPPPYTQAMGNTAGFGLNRGGFRIDPYLHPQQGGAAAAAAGGSSFASMPTLWDPSHTSISHK